MFKAIKVGALTIGTALLPAIAFAEIQGGPMTANSIVDGIKKVAGIFQAIIFAIAIIMILVAAFQFITAGGNEEKVATARKSLMWGLIGLAVALFAYVALPFVQSVLGTLFGGGTQLVPGT